MSLDELLAVISARVREEIQAQVMTPYHPAATGTVPALATAPQATIQCQALKPGSSLFFFVIDGCRIVRI